MQNYYLEVLGLSHGATKKDIKAAYRRLSKLYHPDVNSDPQAKEQFIRITEAYKFLSQVGPQPSGQARSYDYDPFKESYRRQRAKARYWARQRAKEATKQHFQAVRRFNEMFTYPLIAVVVINLILGLDFLLPTKSSSARVIEVTPEYQNKRIAPGVNIRLHNHDRIHFEHHSLRVKYSRKFYSLADQNVTLKRTALIGIVREIRTRLVDTSFIYRHPFVLYDFFCFLIPLMLTMALVYQYARLSLELRMSLAVLIFMTFIIEISSIWFA